MLFEGCLAAVRWQWSPYSRPGIGWIPRPARWGVHYRGNSYKFFEPAVAQPPAIRTRTINMAPHRFRAVEECFRSRRSCEAWTRGAGQLEQLGRRSPRFRIPEFLQP